MLKSFDRIIDYNENLWGCGYAAPQDLLLRKENNMLIFFENKDKIVDFNDVHSFSLKGNSLVFEYKRGHNTDQVAFKTRRQAEEYMKYIMNSYLQEREDEIESWIKINENKPVEQVKSEIYESASEFGYLYEFHDIDEEINEKEKSEKGE